jgi:hypothetical protein
MFSSYHPSVRIDAKRFASARRQRHSISVGWKKTSNQDCLESKRHATAHRRAKHRVNRVCPSFSSTGTYPCARRLRRSTTASN